MLVLWRFDSVVVVFLSVVGEQAPVLEECIDVGFRFWVFLAWAGHSPLG